MRRGHTVIVAGKVTPTDMAGQKVLLTLQKRNAQVVLGVVREEPPGREAHDQRDGAYSWKYTPKLPGLYRVKAWIPNTSAYNKIVTDWRRFRVK